MTPNKEAATVLQHRALTILSAIYRNESGAYWTKYRPWMKQWVHPDVFGAIEGLECLDDAWHLQADIEEALLTNASLCGALLD